MPTQHQPVIIFASERAANFAVAGIPAAARAVATLAGDPAWQGNQIQIAVPRGWCPSSTCTQEASRLAPGVDWEAINADDQATEIWIPGSDVQTEHRAPTRIRVGARSRVAPSGPPELSGLPELRGQARRILKATGKPGDGLVSRTINRPISRTITLVVLRWSGARPWHATLVAALIGAVMFVALILGGETGLLLGAALFQLASIVDGVDGEMARATFRSSERGAMLDSVADAATNVSFIGGASYNLYASGAEQAGLAGAAGCCMLAVGKIILGLQSRRDGGAFTFDALKSRFRERPSRLRQWLTYLTMRDFYAFAAFLAIIAGFAQSLLFIFVFVAAGWLAVLCWMLRTPLPVTCQSKD